MVTLVEECRLQINVLHFFATHFLFSVTLSMANSGHGTQDIDAFNRGSSVPDIAAYFIVTKNKSDLNDVTQSIALP